jgi:DNA-binding XRE family transcriptional regulator
VEQSRLPALQAVEHYPPEFTPDSWGCKGKWEKSGWFAPYGSSPSLFASRLRQLREAAGLTQVQLAERAGPHLHGITKLEQGNREPAWSPVLALAEALGVDCMAFVANSGSEEAAPKPSRGRPPKKPQ